MDELRAILNIAPQVMTFLILVGGVVAYVLRKYITAWIRSKFESEIGKQLASHKHNLDRELAAYKMSLVRELEQQKANIDLRRSIALQIASTNLSALTQLFADLNTWVNKATAYTVYPPDVRKQTQNDFNQLTLTTRTAYRNAEIHLSADLRVRISNLMADLHRLAFELSNSVDRLDPKDARITGFLSENVAINDLLRQEVEKIGRTALDSDGRGP